jgi:hypothetical protein
MNPIHSAIEETSSQPNGNPTKQTSSSPNDSSASTTLDDWTRLLRLGTRLSDWGLVPPTECLRLARLLASTTKTVYFDRPRLPEPASRSPSGPFSFDALAFLD